MSSSVVQIPGLVPAASPVARRAITAAITAACGVAVAGLVSAAVVGWSQVAVLGSLGLAVIVAGLVSLQRTEWTIGDTWVGHRGLFGSTRLDAEAMRAVMVPSDEVRQGDLLFLGPGLRAVALPSDRLRRDPVLAEAAARLLDLAHGGGARVTADAWRLVGRPVPAASTESVGGVAAPIERRHRRRSLTAA